MGVPANCPSGSKYTVTTGYRKVAGDTCVGGVAPLPTEFSCPHWSHNVSHGGWFVLFFILFLVVAMGYVTYTNKGQKHFGGFNGMLNSLKALISGGSGCVSYAGIGERVPDSALDY